MKQLVFILSIVFVMLSSQLHAQNYSTHKVRQGETIEGIAKKYLVTPYEIYALNPDAKKGLSANMVLIIPKSKIASKQQTKVVKELKGFKEHKVKRKETLYSLSKEYNVDQEDLKKHNPFLYSENLKKGQKIKIPLYETTEVVESLSATQPYTVQPKEGKWRVAYKFGITIPELEALNPGMGEVLQEGQVVQVPNGSDRKPKEIDERYGYYEVLPKEGYYRLKVKLGLDQEQLEALNPQLKESGLKQGMILKVPNTIQGSQDENGFQVVDLTKSIKDFDTKHIVVMLPFKLDKVPFDSIADTKIHIKKDPYLSTSLDFYSGVDIALDSLQKLGVSLKVDVVDTNNQMSHLNRILSTIDFENVDAVVGPLMSKNVDKISTELQSFNVPVVSPLSKNVELGNNVFQTIPDSELMRNKVINFVKSDTLNKHIVVISDSKHTDSSNNLKQIFPAATTVKSRKDKEGREANYILVEDIAKVLTPGRNIVFLETENQGFASNVTSILNSLINKETEIILVTTNMNDAFEGDEISNYHLSKLQFHFATISKAYLDDNVFVKQYLDKYGVTPNKKAVRGFDVTMDVVLRLVSSDNLYQSVKDAPMTEYVENKFAFKKKFFGGYFNEAVYLVKYDNLNIVEVK